MKMRSEHGSQIVIPTQVTHHLGDGQFGKRTTGVQAYRQPIGKHLDAHSRVQTMTWSLPRTNTEDGFEDLPETFHPMLLRPTVPDVCPPHRGLTKVHQVITACGTFLEKDQKKGTKGGTLRMHPTRRHVNPPCGIMPNQRLLPRGGLLLFPINGKGIMTFACHNDFGKPQSMQSVSERWCDQPRVHSERDLCEINTLAMQCSLQT